MYIQTPYNRGSEELGRGGGGGNHDARQVSVVRAVKTLSSGPQNTSKVLAIPDWTKNGHHDCTHACVRNLLYVSRYVCVESALAVSQLFKYRVYVLCTRRHE